MSELLVERVDGVLSVTLNRPDALNALTIAMRRDLDALWREAREDRSVRCVLVTGAGRAFCAGADTGELSEMGSSPEEGLALQFGPAAVLDVPVVLAVNGLCVAAGLRFLADADIVLAAEDAWFSDPHVALGQTSGIVALQLAARTSPAAVAPLLLSGPAYRMGAREALGLGLVSQVHPAPDLGARATELTQRIAAQSPSAVRSTLALLRRRGVDPADRAAARSATLAQWAHPDATEGRAALADKRAAHWRD
jgi:enoyl-CoA hydratase/carnithine racemase